MRSVLITGANGGGGRALSERLAARGFAVHACGRGAELDMDVTEPSGVERVAEQVAADVGGDGLHAVINR
ncbi:sugar nucleotide-binding protein [Nonomuraea sp. SMC257]|uniref:Sugar nucleotide-binding protein n=1 Tax=Nonomuraea montanisoli TaxID=2741721 RepID=A0A7Y6M3V6_9ACTN|nr:NAD-dependent epimerase/dehydratase family protein [Nonomuraea montanisoli]NUW32614.1 sugar nucleotide-binding protein [Nonomuraea montanisoli]